MPGPLLLLFLLFLQPALGCHSGSYLECKHAPFVTGHTLVGQGFNVVTMKARAAVVDVHQFINNNRTCTLCHNQLYNQVQKLPTAVKEWNNQMKCERQVTSRMFTSSQSLLKDISDSMGTSWKMDLSLNGLDSSAIGGTLSKTSLFASSHTSRDKLFYASQMFKCQHYSFRLESRPPVSLNFLRALKSLPAKYTRYSKAAYHHFMSVFGTHFFRQVALGGLLLSTTAVPTCEVAMNDVSQRGVRDCLQMDAGTTVGKAAGNLAVQRCRAWSRRFRGADSFGAAFTDRVTEVTGGTGNTGDILINPRDKEGYKRWFNSLKYHPGLVSYDLSSLHMLVDDPRRRSSLRDAISDYIRGTSVSLSCPDKPCKTGWRASSDCQCKCTGNRNNKIDSNCCSTMPGVARLVVTVIRATGLKGDYVTRTDGYVRVFYRGRAMETKVIWNNDYPYWNRKMDFGNVDLTKKTPVHFEVWDRDHGYDDDLLGKGSIIPTQGLQSQKSFKLNRGNLYVSLTAVCGPSLTGGYCQKYAASQGSQGMLGNVQEDWEGGLEKPTLLQEVYGVENDSFL